MIKDYFVISFRNIMERKLRSLLTMIGIFIGIAAVVSLVSLGQGLQKSINQQFEMLGVDKVLITPGGGFFGVGASATLTTKDLEVIQGVNGVKTAGGMLYTLGKVKFKDETKYSFVIGMDQESWKLFGSISGFEMAEGREQKATDKYKAQIGYLIRKGEFFKEPVKLRDILEIEGKDFTVIASYTSIGNPSDDSQIYIPLDTAREIFNMPDELMMIFLQVDEGADPEKVADDIEKKLRKSRDVKEGEEDFSVETSAGMMESYGTIINVVQAVVIGLASISLFVGGIGIMNTMFTSVLQRTNEIGVMKAIGAKNKDIMLMFLIESGMIGLAGGAVGIVIGIGLSEAIIGLGRAANWTILQASFPWYLIVGSLVFSFVVGTLSGVLPAMQASKLKPVDALRYE